MPLTRGRGRGPGEGLTWESGQVPETGPEPGRGVGTGDERGGLLGFQQTSVTWSPRGVCIGQHRGSVTAPRRAGSGPGGLPLLHLPLPSPPQQNAEEKQSPRKTPTTTIPPVPSRPPSRKTGKRGAGELQPWRRRDSRGGQPPSPHYLDLLSEVLPAGEELVQRVLGVLHVAAIFPVDQKPGQ